ncbi:pyrroline-5-carboxylate reductase [Bifidobacterium pullorum subsp. saeculare]|uniref:Pyrroline-5-carboxylate reductase n=1 Tax=Bifidobacterium pullorum subsp. saeculare TaxID=78257 RepID=A0A938WVY9_9BIFI|nr:pyrroline-5-carboxylate reductase [Bifidobacterium pullorum]MBM6699880.1 pyrroline-5-carboxylate reductase [Bifidobacterium pullorum subsp. saeculare]
MSLTIGFIGYGAMASAIARGLVDAGVVVGGDIVACAAHYDALAERAAALGVRPLHSAVEVASAADVVVVAVKPHQVEEVVGPLAHELAAPGRFVVSIAAGWTLERYRALFGETEVHVQCTIPNTPMEVGQGVLIAEAAHTLTDEQTATFERMFEAIGLIERVDTAHMDIAMTIAGCGPAFADMFLEALGDAGVKHGLKRATAYRLAAKMIEGVGALQLATGAHPGVMKDAVCSPGGTTIKGVACLEENGFRGAVIKAVDAIVG